MTWIPGVGWDKPLEPANLRAQVLCWTGSRFVSADWWDKHSAVSFDLSRKPEQKEPKRPTFGQRGRFA